MRQLQQGTSNKAHHTTIDRQPEQQHEQQSDEAVLTPESEAPSYGSPGDLAKPPSHARTLSPATVLTMQRALGNSHVQRLVASRSVQKPTTLQRQPDPSLATVQRDNAAPAAPAAPAGGAKGPGIDATVILNIYLNALKVSYANKLKVGTKRPFGKYAEITSWNLGGEVGAEGAAQGPAVIPTSTNTNGWGDSSKKALNEVGTLDPAKVDKSGKVHSEELKVSITDLLKDLADVHSPVGVDLKVYEGGMDYQEEKAGVELSGKMPIAKDDAHGFKYGLDGSIGTKFEIYNFNLTDPSKSKFGTVTPYIALEGSIKKTINPSIIDGVTLPSVDLKGKAKISGEMEITPNKGTILADLATKIGAKAGGKVVSQALGKVSGAMKSLYSVPGAMVAGGVASVLTLLHAWETAELDKNLGELGQRLAFVYAGALKMEREEQGTPSGGGGDPMIVEFGLAGVAAARKQRDADVKELIDKVRAEVGEEPTTEEATAEVNKRYKEKPADLLSMAVPVVGLIKEEMLKIWVKQQENSLITKGMNTILGIFGGSLGDPKNSQDYKVFERALNAYLMSTPRALDDMKKEFKDKNGHDPSDKELQAFFAEKAREAQIGVAGGEDEYNKQFDKPLS